MEQDEQAGSGRWARFRLYVVGPLLAAPPRRGELSAALATLAAKSFTHPLTGEPVRFGRSTIERWYYQARNAGQDPLGALARQVRKDAGTQPSMPAALARVLRAQWQDHPGWSCRLHVDNLEVLVNEDSSLGPMPSYSTVRRYMKRHGLERRPRRRRGPHQPPDPAPLQAREVRSFEAEYVNGLWHLDFHECSRKLLMTNGTWRAPKLLAVLDDRSRLICHAQWYWAESAESLVHALSQAFQKRALPRTLLTDNGQPMLAGETRAGLERLGILHETTLVRSPYQNGKQEVFFGAVEGRLLPMLEGQREITLELLNRATQAWVEHDYHRTRHRETGVWPLVRYQSDPNVGRESPDSRTLRQAFRIRQRRRQRRSDGTISLQGRRFEVPSRYRQCGDIYVRYARWDLATVDMVDPQTDAVLCPLYPLDRARNADGLRRPLARLDEPAAAPTTPPAAGIAPLLRKLMADYSASGLPPAYLAKPEPTAEQTPSTTRKDIDNE
jgi:putative transposase